MKSVSVRDAHLILVLALLANGLLGSLSDPENLTGTLYLALFLHVGLTIYEADFSRTRAVTWPLLIGMAAVSEVAALPFISVPWTAVAAVLLIVLGLDLAVMQRDRWRGMAPRRIPISIAMIVLAAAVLGIALSLGLSVFATAPPETAPPEPDLMLLTPARITPEWYILPCYALLRASSDKFAGVLLMIAALLVPAIWPWMRTARLRVGRTRWFWRALCAALVLDWIGLGILGSRFPGDAVIRTTQALAGFHFAFFLLLPILLRRWSGAGPSPAGG